MFDKVVYGNPFLLQYCPDKYKTKTLCDESVDDCLAA